MKKTLILLSIFAFLSFDAQESCGFDHIHHKLEEKNPEIKKRREAAEAKLRKMDIPSYLKSMGLISKNGNQTQIHEIPVVVHVIESSNPNATNLTDEQIQTWIDNANKMYATTYGIGYYPEGEGVDGGTVIPFKLVMAKRDPQCNATTGIVRYDGNSLTGYTSNGVNFENGVGPTEEQIIDFAPHWPENSYYNIYLISGFDGDYTDYGLMGYAYFPVVPDNIYHTFMKAPVVTKFNDSTLAHEFGHSLGLLHPFQGASSNGVANNNEPACPTNNNCQTDNDLVCDTEPTKSLLSTFQTPTNNQINECTGANYQGVQYNIMNYTNDPRKFTPGQRDRALALFTLYRGSLFSSKGAIEPDNSASINLTPASCNVTGVEQAGITGSYGLGPVKVELNNINNTSSTINAAGNNAYIDYTTQTCLSDMYNTDISSTEQSTIKISITSPNGQKIKAWIDYNNNGSFEDNEVIAEELVNPGPGWNQNVEKTFTFTPPTNAVLNTYLRMRVAADGTQNVNSCGLYVAGQAEDYAVRIVQNLSVEDVNTSNENFTIAFNPNANTLELVNVNSKFGDYKIYDMSGKLIESGSSDNNKIKLNKTPKGTYLLQFEFKGEKVSHKFIK